MCDRYLGCVDFDKPTALPKRNAIDAFLSAGATVPSSEKNASATSKEPAIAQPIDDGVALNANANVSDANLAVTAQEHGTEIDREPREAGIKNGSSERYYGQDQAGEKSQAAARRLSSRFEQAERVSEKVNTLSRNQSTRMAEMTKTDASGLVASNDEVSVSMSQSKGQKHDHVAKAKLKFGTELVQPAKVARDKSGAQEETVEKSRPRRQAKQSALEKLRAKNNKQDGETADNTASDSADDGSEFHFPGGDGKQGGKQLPTPVTHGNAPKETTEPRQHGKLKSVKPQQQATAISAKQLKKKIAAGDDFARSRRVSVGVETTMNQEKNTRSATPAISAGVLTVRQKMQQTSRDESPPRRHGALKRPTRALSRGRRPQVEDRYAFPENTPGTKRKGRSVSKASKASTVKPGPTRQRMQSESVKGRLDRTHTDSRQPSVPRQSHTGDSKPPLKDSRPIAAVRTKKPSQPPTPLESRGRRRDLTVTSQQKPGSSQANAITIEQASNSSSSSSPSPRQRTTTQLKTTAQASTKHNDILRPRTPAVVRSSPPGTGTGSTYTHVKDKPTIIAFGRHGPRNQGTASATREPRSASSAKMLSGSILSKQSTPFSHGRKAKFPSEHPLRLSQPGLQSRKQTIPAAEPSNVAADNEDIFGAFSKNRKNKGLDNKGTPPAKAGTVSDQDNQNDGFALIDDFDDTTLVNDYDPPTYSQSIEQLSASQLAMPPPKAASKDGSTLKAVDASARIPKKTDKSVRAKDTPRPASTRQDIGASSIRNQLVPKSNKPPVNPIEATGRMPSAAAAKSATNTVKAYSSEPQSVAPIGQGTRKRGQTVPHTGSPPKKRKAPPKDFTHEVTKGPKPAQTKGLSTAGQIVPQNEFLETLKNGHEWARKADKDRNVPTGDPVKRSDRIKNRAGRRTTQGFQCVDILGSPYPKDLDVPTKTTALETYSQQADLSSDQMTASNTALERSLDLKAAPRMEPKLRLGLVSSNGKPIPAAPQESSKAVTRIASGPLAEQLLMAKSADTSDNPFNTSSLVRRLNEPTVNRYKEALRQHGIVLEDEPFARRLDEREEQADDTDMTLVEPVNNHRKTAQHVANSPVASESSRASTVDAATKVLEDVGDWRNSLKPYQTHLFDALVIAAHKLVRHMVDQETANRTIVADFRRRGEIIVTELEREHAREYQQHSQSLQGLKKQAVDELTAYGRKVKQSIRDAEKARAERKKASSARSEVDEMLRGLVAGLDD